MGSEGSSGAGCEAESGTDVIVEDDFVTPVSSDYFLVDPVKESESGTVTAIVETFTFSSAIGQPSNTRLFSPTGRWFRHNCGSDFFLIPEGGPAVTIPGLLDRAIAQIDPPEPILGVTPNHGKHVVRMPSWLAVDQDYWNQPRTAIATSGRVQVQATLTPTGVLWDMGNGETHTCDNPGVQWLAGMDESQSTCGYTYTYPSINPPDNTYELAGTVSFDVTHQTNAPGTFGPWVPVERTTIETIEVVEIQAVSTQSPLP